MLNDLPNLLTVSRMAAIPVFVVLFFVGGAWAHLAACALFILAAFTDYLDGKLARARKRSSDFGRLFDPIADKLLVGATLMLLVGFDRMSKWALIPAIVIMLREILVSGLREFLASVNALGLPVTRLAKVKTGVQMVAIGTLIGGDSAAPLLALAFLPVTAIGEAMLWVAAGLTIVTGWDYLRTGLGHAMGNDAARTPEARRRSGPGG
ncbi:MAG: CDP-diacylglycerol--glycerol-3-phosphate 3-phosphatidyltransferase [Alphaproteobacteria bacterium]|nr:CDP-diacylglycerol--glycerol-3-phosphate 3-phosphatidyltransferase [Alphaproteobacteria bacterium]